MSERVNIDVTFDDMLNYGHEYEYFEDCLRDRIEQPQLDDDERSLYVVVDDYKAVEIVGDYVIKLEVIYHVETLDS